MIFDIKLDGSFKCRFVVRGDLTTKGEHYLETRSSMVSMEAVRTVLALAAGNDWALTTTDFSLTATLKKTTKAFSVNYQLSRTSCTTAILAKASPESARGR